MTILYEGNYPRNKFPWDKPKLATIQNSGKKSHYHSIIEERMIREFAGIDFYAKSLPKKTDQPKEICEKVSSIDLFK
jgi:hypothetical protein